MARPRRRNKKSYSKRAHPLRYHQKPNDAPGANTDDCFKKINKELRAYDAGKMSVEYQGRQHVFGEFWTGAPRAASRGKRA